MKKKFSEPEILFETLDEAVVLTSGVGVDWNDEWGEEWNPYVIN